jgi:hypothetical protein
LVGELTFFALRTDLPTVCVSFRESQILAVVTSLATVCLSQVKVMFTAFHAKTLPLLRGLVMKGLSSLALGAGHTPIGAV